MKSAKYFSEKIFFVEFPLLVQATTFYHIGILVSNVWQSKLNLSPIV